MKDSPKKIITLLWIVLALTNIFWAVEYFKEKNARQTALAELAEVSQSRKVALFHKLFVNKVLKADGEVDFNTRVELQNSANNTGDKEVIEAWQNFLASKTELEGQRRVKELLSILVNKV